MALITARELQRVELPNDGPAQGALDIRFDFVLGDPGAHFGGEHTCDYPVSGATGKPLWSSFPLLLLHFEHVRWLSTVFVLVELGFLQQNRTTFEQLLNASHFRILSTTLGMTPAIQIPRVQRLQSSRNGLTHADPIIKKSSSNIWETIMIIKVKPGEDRTPIEQGQDEGNSAGH